jgi:hypothetical protein
VSVVISCVVVVRRSTPSPYMYVCMYVCTLVSVVISCVVVVRRSTPSPYMYVCVCVCM